MLHSEVVMSMLVEEVAQATYSFHLQIVMVKSELEISHDMTKQV